MWGRKRTFTGVIAVGISAFIFLNTNLVSAAPIVLKKGMEGSTVISLQNDLSNLGYFNNKATGYYGEITQSAVKQLQKSYGYTQDGIAGPDTLLLLNKLKGKSQTPTAQTLSRTSLLKKGMDCEAVKTLQNNLKILGYFNQNSTGYYGNITMSAVINLQRAYNCTPDGIVGPATFDLIDRLIKGESVSGSQELASRGDDPRDSSKNPVKPNYLLSWAYVGSDVFTIGKVATITDIETSLSFKVKRTYGYNHADCETVTAEDTKIMKKIYGGKWSWTRRAIIVDVDGMKIAASMAGMPHAGVENAKPNAYVKSRSGGYGSGTNLDAVKGNEMEGHFDVHFTGSKTHGTNRVDGAHQAAAKRASEWAKNNY